MNTIALTDKSKMALPKMGIMTHIVELSRHDYIYVKGHIKINDQLIIKEDCSRFWDPCALVLYYKGFKLGYLNNSINKVVHKILNRFGEVQIEVKNISSKNQPFDGVDVLIKIQ